jgi:hypothetical protein
VPLKFVQRLPLDKRKILYDIINPGIGVPEGVSAVVNEELR